MKITGKSHKDSSLVNKVDWRAVPQFPFRRYPEPVYICGHLHCYAQASKIGCMFAFLMFCFFIF